MPGFPVGATVVSTVQDWSFSFIWVDGSKPVRRLTNLVTGVTTTQLDNMAAGIAALSNAGLLRYQGVGISKEIAINSVEISDEAHGIKQDLLLNFQKQNNLDTFQFRIPAPDAALFDGGIILKSLSDSEQGTRITTAINSILAPKNQGLTEGSLWEFTSGFLSTANSRERRVIPPNANITEPGVGEDDEGPGLEEE